MSPPSSASSTDNGPESPELSPLITPNHDWNLEMFFAYPGHMYQGQCGYKKAIMGMFYNSEHMLLSIASFGFKQLLDNEQDDTSGNTSRKHDPEPEFRIYTKLVNKPQRRADVGYFWKSV